MADKVWFDRPMNPDDIPADETGSELGGLKPYYILELGRYSYDPAEFDTEKEAWEEACSQNWTGAPYGVFQRVSQNEDEDELICILYAQDSYYK